ncbi:MAG: hypothetical protein RhofKO_39930 [Rhodothermales bacterium]
MPHHSPFGFIIAFAALALIGCDRTFVDETPPELDILAPGFDIIFETNRAELQVQAFSFREIALVTVNGEAMNYQAEQDTWRALILLDEGMNTFVVTATDVGGLATSDTLIALRTALAIQGTPLMLPEPRYGHTATRLLSGDVLVTGGATNESDGGTTKAFLVDDLTGQVTLLPASLNEPRVGHTATLVPDGRVFILGGSRTSAVNLEDERELVEAVEVFDPVTQTFSIVPVDGPAIRRTEHTATLYAPSDGLFIDVYGGRGDVDYFREGTLATRYDARRFEWVEGTLFARSPSIGLDIEPIAGHASAPLSSPTALPYQNLVVGTYFLDDAEDTAHWFFNYTEAQGFREQPAPAPQLSRTQHSATTVADGIVLLFGGDKGAPTEPAFPSELYIDAVQQYYQFSSTSVPPVTRSQHTATFVGNGRILILGGLTPAGQPTATSHFFHLPL